MQIVRGRLVRAGIGLAAAVLMIAQLGGCAGTPVAGKARAVGEIDTKTVGGKPLTDGPSGPREGVPDAQLEVENGDGSEMDRLAINAVSDLYDYWGERLPADFDEQFEPLKRLVSYDSDGTPIRVCGESTAGLVNAFYCGRDDSISWDRGVLLPFLDKQFGPMAVVTVLAHEMGHAIQFRLLEKSNISQSTPTIVKEQQADCYAGNFFAHVAEGKSKHFQINTGEGLNKVLATMFFIRDPAGLSANTRGAHGLAFDRVFAFQEGYTKGPKRCAQMDPKEINDRIAEKERSEDDEKTQGEADITDPRVLELFKQSLDEAFKDNGATPPELNNDGARCDSGDATSPVAFCPDENVVAMDLPKLKEIATPPKRTAPPGADSTGIGDFAAFAEVASRYALAIQKSIGAPLEGEDVGLRTACLTGAWAGFVDKPGPALRLAVGDLDEAVAELLQDNSLIAADVKGTATKVGFARVEAFRVGYFEGSGRCTEIGN
ncbi:MAG TPA: neutral zinc metallopeptidase [Actinophytocola sp.]|uniref:neutral zinc metallopeptidase n=1 Tax=Actinophytocola sp. TaxID=1872138 RepID=UPI002DDD36A3|nr:neutral zinc metallopeptidase [Actinophytocola sp.]HEV2782088.1 neutral zinc metallopeptidase [Actinophytocola sp.]